MRYFKCWYCCAVDFYNLHMCTHTLSVRCFSPIVDDFPALQGCVLWATGVLPVGTEQERDTERISYQYWSLVTDDDVYEEQWGQWNVHRKPALMISVKKKQLRAGRKGDHPRSEEGERWRGLEMCEVNELCERSKKTHLTSSVTFNEKWAAYLDSIRLVPSDLDAEVCVQCAHMWLCVRVLLLVYPRE